LNELMLTLLVLTDLLLATGVFLLLARPDLAISLVVRSAGVSGGWFEEHLGAEELGRLRRFASVGGWLALALLFAWSFAVGAWLTVIRLPVG
jgi:uncharacterized membrane protein